MSDDKTLISDSSGTIPISNNAIILISLIFAALHILENISISNLLPFYLCALMLQQSSQEKSNFKIIILSLIPYIFLFQILFSDPTGFDILYLSTMGIIWMDSINESTALNAPVLFASAMMSFSVILSLLMSGPHFGSLFCLLLLSLLYFKNLTHVEYHLSYQFALALLFGCLLCMIWNPSSPVTFFNSKSAESSLMTNVGGLILGFTLFRFLHESYNTAEE